MAAASASMGAAGGGNPNANVVQAVLSKVSDSVKQAASQQRPWSELVDRSNFARPDSLPDAMNRIKKNLSYFRANYLAVLLGIVVLSMLWNPTSILWLALLAVAWTYLFMVRTEPIVISGRAVNEREKFLGMAAISLLIVFGLTSVGSVLMSGVIVGFAAICIHAALRVPDDLFLDDGENGSFLAFFGTGPAVPNTIPTAL